MTKMTNTMDLLSYAVRNELEAACIYSYFADLVQGPERLTFRPYFLEERDECMEHASQVRTILLDMGASVIDHLPTTLSLKQEDLLDLDAMLHRALKLETQAANRYAKILQELGTDLETIEVLDTIEQILIAERNSMSELMRIIGD